MHQTVTAPVAAPPDRVAEIIGDLATYPEWLELVTAVEPTTSSAGPAAADAAGTEPAWLVTIRAKVGPFARSKKLRMVRTVADSTDQHRRFRFERRELDGRKHSAWTLDASVGGIAEDSNSEDSSSIVTSCIVTMDLRYDGALWTAPLEPILGSFIADAGPSLERYANRSETA